MLIQNAKSKGKKKKETIHTSVEGSGIWRGHGKKKRRKRTKRKRRKEDERFVKKKKKARRGQVDTTNAQESRSHKCNWKAQCLGKLKQCTKAFA